MSYNLKPQKVDDYVWKIPREGKMRVDGIIFASEKLINTIKADEALKQVANVATLPGIVKASFAMPDIHWGYGFPIGGVAAFDVDDGVVSPGGVGYDISCGVRLMSSELRINEVRKKIPDLLQILFREIPTGVGSHRRDLRLKKEELNCVLEKGATWAAQHGFGDKADIDKMEEGGCIRNADASLVSERALERGHDQLGTLGSGNHFAEIQYVEEIYDNNEASRLGLFKDQLVISVHTGSRGLGYQICDDYLDIMARASQKYHIELPDRQLCSAPINSPEGKEYLSAMAAAANFAMANRQMIAHYIREVFEKFLRRSPSDLGLKTVYDVSHNLAKFEEHRIGGISRRLLVHRKGATRASPGQPVLIPGDMGRCSYVLIGTKKAMDLSFGSTCHGAGRVMSRNEAKRRAKGRNIVSELAKRGIEVIGASSDTIVEEMPEAYKDVSDVVDVVDSLGISTKVAKLVPVGCIKG